MVLRVLFLYIYLLHFEIQCILILFLGTPSRLGGVNLEMLALEAFERHHSTFRVAPDNLILRDAGGFHWRAGGEKHINDPASIAALQVSFYQLHQ